MTEPSLPEESIFLKALEIPSAAERLAYLDRACGEDRQMRAAVEALLNANQKSGDLLDLPDKSAVTVDVQAASEEPGIVIDAYKLLQQIGEGGMGTVWMAKQTEPVQRQVALKLIKSGMDSKQVIARFEAERQALALMDHPNIAKVLDAGTTDRGLPYFVMELVKGVPITKYCDEHRLTPKQRLELFVPVCQAVQHAHQKGIIHRDLKPSNVMVCLYDDKPVPKVIDFGVAKATGRNLTESTMFTEIGQVVGTLEYMSPEQAELNQLDIDTRSDIYSLGVLLYELLTGSTPLERKRLRAAAMLEVLRLIREEEPPKPSTRLSTIDEMPSVAANRGMEPKKLSGIVRGELDWIVMKTLEKDRNRRYETANGFAADIGRYLIDEPVLACPPSTVYRLRKFARRNKVTLTFASLTLLFIVVLGSSAGWMLRDRTAREEEFANQRIAREQEFSRQNEAREQEIVRKRKESEAALNGEVDRALEEADRLGEREKWPEARDAAERAEKLLASAGRSDRPPRLVALQKDLTMAQRLEEIYRNPPRNPVREAPSDTNELVPSDVEHDPERDPAIVPVTAPMPVRIGVPGRLQPAEESAEEESFRGREQDARFAAAFQEFGIDVDALEPPEAAARIGRTAITPALVKALDDWASLRRRARGENDAGWKKLVGICQLADRDAWRNRFRGALLVRDRQALETLAAEVSPRDAPPATLLLLAQTLKQLGALEQAMSVLVQAQRQFPDDLWLNDALAWLSFDAYKPPRYADALRFYTVASALRPRSPQWHDALAKVNYQMHLAAPVSAVDAARFQAQSADQAIAEYSRVIELQPHKAAAWKSRADCYRGLDQWCKAAADYSKAIELKPDDAMAWQERGECYLYLQQCDKALADYSKAFELNPRNVYPQRQRAAIYQSLQQWDKAAADYSKIIELKPEDAMAWSHRGSCYSALRQSDKAAADYSKAIELYSEAIESKPDDTAAWKNRADFYWRLQQWDKAAADYSKAIELKPNDALAWYRRGWCYKYLQQWDKALAHYTEEIESKPDDAVAWKCRANVYWRLEQWDKAAADYSKIIELNPNDAGAWSRRGSCYTYLQQSDKAAADVSKASELNSRAGEQYSKAIELKPDDGSAWLNRARHYQSLQQWDKAAADFSKAIELKPDDALAWQERGWCYSYLKQWDEALADSSKAIELNPRNMHPQHQRARIYERLKEWDKAAADYSKIIELQPDDARAWINRGECYSRLQQWDQAAADYSKIIELSPNDAGAWSRRGFCYSALQQSDKAAADVSKAIELYSEAIESKPDDLNAWNNRAHCYLRLEQWDKALADYSKAIELDPRFVWPQYQRAAIYERLKEWDQAAADYSKIIELNPGVASAWGSRAACYSVLQQWDKALADYSKVIELRPDDAGAWSSRAICCRNLGRQDEALAADAKAGELNSKPFFEAIELKPDDASAWLNRARYYSGLQQWDKAIADCSKAIELKPDDASAWCNRGWCYFYLGQPDKAAADYSKAIELYSKAIELDPSNVWPLQQRATIYLTLKEWGKAAADYSKIIELKPDDGIAWRNRGSCHYCLRQWDKALADYSKAIELKPDDADAWHNRGLTHQSRMEPDKVLSDFAKAIELDPKSAPRHNNIAWSLVTWPGPNLRHPATGLALATKAVELAPEEGTYRNTLGVAQYRAGDWKAAIEALNKSIELRKGGDAYDWFFLAMAHWREGSHDEALRWYEKAAAWREQNANDNEELERFDAEAKEVMRATES